MLTLYGNLVKISKKILIKNNNLKKTRILKFKFDIFFRISLLTIN